MGYLRLPLIIIFFLLFLPNAKATDITATGGWTETIGASNLISGAGSDLNSTYESAANATTINISNPTGKGQSWQVNVKRSDVIWDSNFTLLVRRRSDGTLAPGGSISGGLGYIAVQTSDVTFFNGKKSVTGIAIQYQLTGMSIDISPGNYSTTVIYTVVDL